MTPFSWRQERYLRSSAARDRSAVQRESLEALLERLQTTKSIEELQVWAHELRDHLGVAHVMYHTGTLKREQIGAFTYSLEWAHTYVERRYMAIDPVVLGALKRFHPMDWKSLDWSNPLAREMRRKSIAAGLGNQGWSIPIWGPQGEFALFAVNHTADDADWADFTSRNAKELLLISHLMHQQAMQIINNEMDPPTAELSARAGDADAAELGAEPGGRRRGAQHLREYAAGLYRLRPSQTRRRERHARGRHRPSPRDHRSDGGVAKILEQRTLGLY